MPNHLELAKSVHQQCIDAGWWKQDERPIVSPEGFVVGKYYSNQPFETYTIPRNIGELLCLIHSEMSEAYEGYKLGLKDDHLPEYPMFSVELADAAIRLYDTLGYYKANFDTPETALFNSAEPIPTLLLEFHLRISQAMEHFRKGREAPGCEKLIVALRLIWLIAAKKNITLEIIIEEKREYNRNRADHKIENRKAEGGKKF